MGDYNKTLGKEFLNLTESEKQKLIYDYTVGSIHKLPRLFIYKLQRFLGNIRCRMVFIIFRR